LFFLRLSSSAVIKRHEVREVQHLRMSIAAPTFLSSFTFSSSLTGGETTDPDDDDNPDDDSMNTRLERTLIETTQVAH
jgi:hypothetical protein